MFVNLSTVNRANEVDEIKSYIEHNPNGVESKFPPTHLDRIEDIENAWALKKSRKRKADDDITPEPKYVKLNCQHCEMSAKNRSN